MDRGIDWIVGAPSYPEFTEPAQDTLAAWPEAEATLRSGEAQARFRYAPERTPLLSATRVVDLETPEVMLMTLNARDITRTVRAERFRLAIVIAMVVIASVLLSLFLARTIVRPLRRLARAAVRVRLGRAREVVVPRLPSRRDEIGTLARALSDMTQALRERIDAGEHFAADVTHELKNPIASVRSAIEGLGRVTSDAQRTQLLAIADEDVRRLDRLVTDISDASRIDAQLSRASFEPVDVGLMIESMLAARCARNSQNEDRPRIAFARPRKGTTAVMGDGHRIERAIDNVIDNAAEVSPDWIGLTALRDGEMLVIEIADRGPGFDPEMLETIGQPYRSTKGRPGGGLGLFLLVNVVRKLGGLVSADNRDTGGAVVRITLPIAAIARGEGRRG